MVDRARKRYRIEKSPNLAYSVINHSEWDSGLDLVVRRCAACGRTVVVVQTVLQSLVANWIHFDWRQATFEAHACDAPAPTLWPDP
jgi:hypothetical protein